MRPVPEALRAQFAAGVTTLAHAWRVTRADGVTRGFTDHDRDLVVDGVVCRARAGFAAGDIDKRLGVDADATDMAGVLCDDGVDEDDLLAGLWDGARVDLWRVDWTDPALRVHLYAGRIGVVRRGPVALTADVRGLQAGFDTPFGRVFSRFCDADVGDARCGVNLSSAAFAGEGAVASRPALHTVIAVGLGAFAEGWFTRGVLTWPDGVRSEVRAHRVAGAVVTLELAAPARAAGTAFTITAGCDKRIETCRAKFANALNFRGFPAMPGNDAVAAGVDPGQPLDGGSRRSA
jgi:uncharacterized phage protein (TIGR02218 family)